jgi:hypothetical protein
MMEVNAERVNVQGRNIYIFSLEETDLKPKDKVRVVSVSRKVLDNPVVITVISVTKLAIANTAFEIEKQTKPRFGIVGYEDEETKL